MTHIAFTNVQKRYGKTAVVHGIDFGIQAGEFIVILGPSGCGKSTLLRMLAGLEEISGGEMTIDGTVVNELEPRERGCAMVFQNYALYPHMSVADNIGYALRVAGITASDRRPRIEAVARTVGLVDFLDRKPAQLSGGQRQRVAMARAMIREPKIFLFDEPLSNLDAKLRVQMRIEIRKLHNRLGVTSIFVTHDQIEAMTLADRLVVMNAGRIEQAGAPRDVYRRPASLFVAGFVGSPPMNLLPMTCSGRGRVERDGQALNIPDVGAAPGQQLTIGVRPEDIIVNAAHRGRDDIELDVDFVEELGASRLLHGRFQGVDFAVQSPAAEGLSTGRLSISLPATAMHVFDTATGKRLETAQSVEPALAAE